MIRKKFFLFLNFSIILFLSLSCNTLSIPYGDFQKDSASSGTNISNSTVNNPEIKKEEKKKEEKKKTENKEKQNKNKEEKKKASSILPTDRESLHSGHSQTQFSAQDLENGVITGDWTIEEVGGDRVNPDTPAYLKFVPKEKRVYGNNGCNTINAEYLYNPEEHSLSFTNLLSTMRLCQSMYAMDDRINHALNHTVSYNWTHEGEEYYLSFFDADGNKLMTLMHQSFDFLNGAWCVEKIEEDYINDPEMRLVIDIDELKIHGNTGCNLFNGEIDIDMETANTINFHNIVTTRMACENPENQTRLIVALEDVAHAKPIDASTVLLVNLLRQPVLTLKRL